MDRFKAGLLGAAAATAFAVAFAVVSAYAEEPATVQAQKRAEGEIQSQVQGQAQGQIQDQTVAPAESQTAQAAPIAASCPGNPDAIGTSRVLPIDFSEYQQLGHMQYPDSLPLDDKEVVLTFDDGPLPPYTNEVLDILAAQCVKATFFMVGEMARAFPATVRRVYEEGHTIGTHSDHHPIGFGRLPLPRMNQEIDGGIADVSGAFGGDSRYLAPFFRIPGLERSDLLDSELAKRGLVVFSADVVADDWHHDITPERIISLAMSRLERSGKGILLLHDIHPKTVAALPGLLKELKANGFRIVQVVPSAAYEIAMARKPAARMLASAVPGELTIDRGDTTAPAWPNTADRLAPDDIVLPVPDAAAFEPDAGLTDEAGTVEWPEAPQTTAALPETEKAKPRAKRGRLAVERRERQTPHVVRSAKHEPPERDRGHEHLRSHTGAATERNHASRTTRAQTFATALSTPRASH